jgi:hypothetical protein
MNTTSFGLVLAALAVVSLSSVLATAQLGEVAGGLVFNVSLGGTQSNDNFTIVNAGSGPIGFSVMLPQFNNIPNTTAPTVTIYPMNGTLAPHSQKHINVTVYVPTKNNTVGLRWDGLIQVLSVLNQSDNPGGAVIQTGVGKEIIITTKAQEFNWQLIGLAILIAAAIAYVAYMKLKQRDKRGRRNRRQKASGHSSLIRLGSKRSTARKTGRKTARRTTKKRARSRRRR